MLNNDAPPINGIGAWLYTTRKALVFILYMGLSVLYGLLVHASRRPGSRPFSPVVTVLTAELLKLIVNASIFLYMERSWNVLLVATAIRMAGMRLFAFYAVPAMLYAVYNNLAYVSLGHFDPPSYFILLQLRVIITGMIFQVLFGRRLSARKWFALVGILIGCVTKEMGPNMLSHFVASAAGYACVLAQMLASCAAGAYNEKLLKDASQTPVSIQNMFMAGNSVVWGSLGVLWRCWAPAQSDGTLRWDEVVETFRAEVMLIVVVQALIGVTTGFFLRYLDVVLKAVASALEIGIAALCSSLVFGTPLHASTLMSAVIIAASSVAYTSEGKSLREISARFGLLLVRVGWLPHRKVDPAVDERRMSREAAHV